MAKKTYPTRVKKALSKISCSEVIRYYEYRDCVELVVNKWGDVITYRIYDNGDVFER